MKCLCVKEYHDLNSLSNGSEKIQICIYREEMIQLVWDDLGCFEELDEKGIESSLQESYNFPVSGKLFQNLKKSLQN